jgi:hypothetical protein
MGIGTVRAAVINVNDLEQGYAFWSAVTGLEVIGPKPPGWHERFGYLGTRPPWKHEIILQVVELAKDETPNRVHLDITPVEDLTEAQIEAVEKATGADASTDEEWRAAAHDAV